jgi:hypothetical protein
MLMPKMMIRDNRTGSEVISLKVTDSGIGAGAGVAPPAMATPYLRDMERQGGPRYLQWGIGSKRFGSFSQKLRTHR